MAIHSWFFATHGSMTEKEVIKCHMFKDRSDFQWPCAWHCDVPITVICNSGSFLLYSQFRNSNQSDRVEQFHNIQNDQSLCWCLLTNKRCFGRWKQRIKASRIKTLFPQNDLTNGFFWKDYWIQRQQTGVNFVGLIRSICL